MPREPRSITSMIHSNKFTGSVCISIALLLAGTASAQIQAGLLGQRYAGVSVFTESLRDRNISNGNGGDLSVNLPAATNLDFAFGGSYERFSDYSVEDKRLFGTIRAHHDLNGFRPFVDLSLIGTWQSSKVGSYSYSSNDGIWAAGVGVEVPVADATAIIGRAAYQKYFKSENGHYWTYSMGLQHWFTERLGGQISVLFWESDSVIYSAGLNIRF